MLQDASDTQHGSFIAPILDCTAVGTGEHPRLCAVRFQESWKIIATAQCDRVVNCR